MHRNCQASVEMHKGLLDLATYFEAAGENLHDRELDRQDSSLKDSLTRHSIELQTPRLPALFQMVAAGSRSIQKLRDYISREAPSRRIGTSSITSRICKSSNPQLRFGFYALDFLWYVPGIDGRYQRTRGIGEFSALQLSLSTSSVPPLVLHPPASRA